MRLNGKVALLSGVGPNMGRATAILYAKEGCSVALVARKEESLQEMFLMNTSLSSIRNCLQRVLIVDFYHSGT